MRPADGLANSLQRLDVGEVGEHYSPLGNCQRYSCHNRFQSAATPMLGTGADQRPSGIVV
jgi:hypothetical protein